MDYHHEQLRGEQEDASTDGGASWRQEWEDRRGTRRARIADDGGYVARVAHKALACAGELRGSPMWGCVREALWAAVDEDGCERPEELVCYGLGDLEGHSGSHQLALLWLLSKELGLAESWAAFDPEHTSQERAALELLGCAAIQQNEQAKRVLRCPTLFYMPHCPFPLYNNLLHANFEAPWNLMILGNDFTFHALHLHPWATVAPQLHRAMDEGLMLQRRLPDTHRPLPPPTTRARPQSERGAGDGHHTADSSRQAFGLSCLYSFPPESEWRSAQGESSLLDRWLADGAGVRFLICWRLQCAVRSVQWAVGSGQCAVCSRPVLDLALIAQLPTAPHTHAHPTGGLGTPSCTSRYTANLGTDSTDPEQQAWVFTHPAQRRSCSSLRVFARACTGAALPSEPAAQAGGRAG